MDFLSSVIQIHNSKFFFSRNELNKILNCYSLGVSKGNWRDYAITFGKNEISFNMYKHTLASPDCILTKIKKIKKNNFTYNLKLKNKHKIKFTEIDELIAIIKRREIHII